MKLKTIAAALAVLATCCSYAQQFNYTLTKDSVGWQELNSQTILNSGASAWAESYRIPIGFGFPCNGNTYDSLTITSNGYIVFDMQHNCALTAFNRYAGLADSSGNYPVIGYELSGSTGNHVLKIQFKEVKQHENPSGKLSYQLVLNENGVTEVVIGTHDFTPGIDSSNVQRIGFLNMNMNSAVRGYFMSGNPSAPGTQQVTAEAPEMPDLFGLPASGTRYYFTPNN